MNRKTIFLLTLFLLSYISNIAQEREAVELVGKASEESRKGNYDSAIAIYTEAIKMDGGYYIAYSGRGLAYMRKRSNNSVELKQNRENSLRDFSIAIDLKPDSPSNFINRSSIYSQLNDFDKALADLQKAEEIDPKFPHIFAARGNIYSKMKNFQSAIDSFTKAIEIKPQSDFYRGRCNAYYDFGKFENAVADCSEAINLSPKYSAWAYYYRGLSRAKLEQNSLAISDFRKTLELESNHLGAKQQLDNLLKNSKN